MIHNLKSLGMALIAVLVMSALVAAAAQAEEETGALSWDEGTTLLKFTQDDEEGKNPTTGSQVFTIEPKAGLAVSFTCDEVHAEATVNGTGAKTITTKSVTYSDKKTKEEGIEDTCTGTAGAKVPFKFNGCNTILHAGTTIENAPMGKTEGTLGITCPEGKVIELSAPGCLLKIPPTAAGTTLGPVFFYTETTTPETVTIEKKIGHPGFPHSMGIPYTTTGAICGTASKENGTLTGNTTVKAFNASGAQTNVTVT